MSRIGMNPVEVPDDVEVLISGQQVTVKGKLGELKGILAPEVTVTREDNRIWIKPRNQEVRSPRRRTGPNGCIGCTRKTAAPPQHRSTKE